MSIYTVSFDVLGVFSGGVPSLLSLYGGVEFSTDNAYVSTTSVSFQIDTDAQGFDSTLLRFVFDANTGSSGDQISISNLMVDGAPVGPIGGVTLGDGQESAIDVGAILTDTQFNPPGTGDIGNAVITGTAGADKLEGTTGNDTIDGLGSNDLLYGGTGNDTINGGDGNDGIYGNSGTNILNGGNGNDRIDGGINNDTINGDAGADRIYGGNGNDIINGGTGNDRLAGNDGVDTIHGNGDDDQIRGGNGGDFLYGDDGDDNIDGQDGNDVIEGGIGSDTIGGQDGNDNIDGGANDDYLSGGQGADTINGGTGNDIIYGGGMDTPDQYNIRDASAGGLSNVWFNEQTQSFYQFVTSGANWLNSKIAAESTVLNGVNGHLATVTSQVELDYFLGVAGTDSYWLDGGDFTNEGVWRWYAGPDSDATHYLEVGSTETNNYEDHFAVGQPNNGSTENYAYLYSQDGGVADSDVNGFAHSVGYIIEWDSEDVLADTATNTLNGDGGNDTIYGGSGIDNINGGADNDRLFGNAGNDLINGDGGNDFIKGGRGNDVLNGGSGNDSLYGGDQTDIQFLALGDVKAYGAGQDGGGTTTLLDDGVGVNFDDNAWKFLEVNYQVTSNTIVSFDFLSTSEAEISGIGFDNDLNIDSNATFKVYGTQNWGRTNYDNYDGSGNWVHYEIDVGNFYTGHFSYFFLVNDDDGGPADNASFRNIQIHEGDDGANTLSGGDGIDDLYGSGGIDTFVFDAITASVDNVHNFSEAGGDVLDLSSIITGFTGDITDHVEFATSGDHVTLRVDANGVGGYSNVAEIRGGDGLDVATLYANGQILI